MEYLCNTNVVIDKNIILNIENICYDKFKEKWYNDSIFEGATPHLNLAYALLYLPGIFFSK
jgi:hypothetical protein